MYMYTLPANRCVCLAWLGRKWSTRACVSLLVEHYESYICSDVAEMRFVFFVKAIVKERYLLSRMHKELVELVTVTTITGCIHL